MAGTKLRWRLRMQNGLFVVLLIAFVALVAYVSHAYRIEHDFTQNARNTLSQSTQELLDQLPGAVQVTVFAPTQSARGDLRKIARDFLTPYQRRKPDINLLFVDPREEPKRVQDAGVRVEGEMVITYNQKTEHLTSYTEQSFVNALMRLAHASDHVVMVLTGHGERRIDGIANYDLGEFGKKLAEKGFKTLALNLALAPEVPANTATLVIAGPQIDRQDAEVDKIHDYIKHGGNLLWLIDAEPLHGLEPLAEQLGLVLSTGVVVDPAAQRLNISPTYALAASYGQHAITNDFNLNTVFPSARQIDINHDDDSEWHATPLIDVAPRGWVETGALKNNIRFDKNRDIAGPITIAYALERDVEDRSQRVVVVGNGNFLSNTFLGNGGNLDLGINIISWLANEDSLITIQPRPIVDGELDLTTTVFYGIVFVFLIALPIGFIATGIWIWWRRRKA